MLRLNNSASYEHLCDVKLTKDKYPVAFSEKVQELMEDCGMTQEEAEKAIPDMEIELEIYYHKGFGLFAVESGAVESGVIFSPYTGEKMEEAEM